jgi:Cu/Ag efflux protein CusF
MKGGFALILTLVTALAVGCSREVAQKWTVKGKIVEVNAAGGVVTIDHQEIPGLMAAMTMGFRVERTAILEGIAPGDAVEFDLEQKPEGLAVTGLRKIDPAALEGSDEPQSYHGEGTVVLVNRKAGAVLLKHDGAEGLPPGELVLPVAPASQLEGLQDGSPVEFTLTMYKEQLVVSVLTRRPAK